MSKKDPWSALDGAPTDSDSSVGFAAGPGGDKNDTAVKEKKLEVMTIDVEERLGGVIPVDVIKKVLRDLAGVTNQEAQSIPMRLAARLANKKKDAIFPILDEEMKNSPSALIQSMWTRCRKNSPPRPASRSIGALPRRDD